MQGTGVAGLPAAQAGEAGAVSKESVVRDEPEDGRLFAQVLDHASRADPYPLYRRMRAHPVLVQQDGTCVATTYAAIRQLLSDPRVSSEDIPKARMHWTGHPIHDLVLDPIGSRLPEQHRPFIFRDPPAHDILRGMVASQFTPQRILAMRGSIQSLVRELLDQLRDRRQINLVADFSYPLPVTVICQLMGVARKDERLFHGWATVLARSLDPDQRQDETAVAGFIDAYQAVAAYMGELIRRKRAHPTDDLLSGLATYKDPDHGRMNDFDLLARRSFCCSPGTRLPSISSPTECLRCFGFPGTWRGCAAIRRWPRD
jgi:cytochrome P450